MTLLCGVVSYEDGRDGSSGLVVNIAMKRNVVDEVIVAEAVAEMCLVEDVVTEGVVAEMVRNKTLADDTRVAVNVEVASAPGNRASLYCPQT